MNKKDCDEIALILACNKVSDGCLRSFFRLDKRIKETYEEYEIISDNVYAISREYDRLMADTYGRNWMLCKPGTQFPERENLHRHAARTVLSVDEFEEYDNIYKGKWVEKADIE